MMAYNPLTGKYTPDPVPTSGPVTGFKPYITTPAQPVTVGPVAPGKRATPGDFRRAEEASNVGAPVYTPSPIGATGEFVEETPSGNKKFRATDGTVFEDEDTYNAYQAMLNEKESALDIKKRESQSAYDLLYAQFAQ